MDLDYLGERMFGSKANAGLSFQIGQLRYILFHDEYIQVKKMGIDVFYHQGLGMASQATPRGRHSIRAEEGLELAI